MRGLDGEGNAANYVETEQIVQFEGGTSSFVQVCMLIIFCKGQNVWIGCEDEKRMNILLFLVIFFFLRQEVQFHCIGHRGQISNTNQHLF